MIIGVMSDTHGNRKLMHQVADMMEAEFGVELILHLGDDYCDATELDLAGHPVRQVPGLWCREYHNSKVPRQFVTDCNGLSVACAHSPKDLRHTERAVAIILFGHTHSALIQLRGRSLYVNPGHLKGDNSRSERPSFAVIEVRENEVHVAIHETDGSVRMEQTLPRSRLA